MYSLPLALLLCFGLTLSGKAQDRDREKGKPQNLGKSKQVHKRIKSQIEQSEKTISKPKLDLLVEKNRSLKGKINFHKSSGGGEYIIGEIEGEEQSDFFMEVDDHSIKGSIILKESKKAYKYYSDNNGDAYIEEVDINEIICIEYEDAPAEAQSTDSEGASTGALALTTLQSLPGANGCVLLDFDGQYVSGTRWNGGNPINAQSSGMSDAAIQEVWEMVSEDFRPFNLNITTDESVFTSYPKNRRMRCIITPTNTAAPGAGGVAYLNSFAWNDDTPCWVFITSAKACGEATSHEIGHTLSLAHDGRTSPSEGYFQGHGNWAPIMGVGYYKSITQWSKGEYANSSNKEDDLAKMTGSTFGLGYRTDDHGGNTGAATLLNISGSGQVLAANNKGLIERTTDIDFFKFSTSGGTCTLNVNPPARHANLDILVKLYNQSGTLLNTFNPSSLSSVFNVNLSAGTYFISVDGTGSGDPSTNGYSDYASIGSYSISGSIPVSVSNQLPVVTIASPTVNASFIAPATVSISANASDADGSVAKVEFYNGSVKLGEDLSSPYTFNWTNVGAGQYSISARAYDNVGGYTISSAVAINVKAANQKPIVTIVSPTSGNVFTAPATIAINANASDSDGSIYKVEFYNGTTKIGEDLTSPYSFNWGNVGAGTYSITARATDDSGAQTTSTLVTVQVNPANQLPVVVLTSPANGSLFNAPAVIQLAATATDYDGTVSKVEFYNGSTKLGEDFSSPFNFMWQNVPTGNYTITAKASDNLGGVVISSGVTLTVHPPTLSYCTSKANNSRYEFIDNVSLGSINNPSGNNSGYADFTSLTTLLPQGASQSIYFKPGFSGSLYREFWSIWIDYNQDGDFTDTGELLVYGSTSGSGTYYAGFTVPANAVIGNTRMRVSMKYNAGQHSCETFSYGEVEDYTVEIVSNDMAMVSLNTYENASPIESPDIRDLSQLTVHPNPASNFITINNIEIDEASTGSIVNLDGTTVKTFEVSRSAVNIDVSDLVPGIYLIRIKLNRQDLETKFIKVN